MAWLTEEAPALNKDLMTDDGAPHYILPSDDWKKEMRTRHMHMRHVVDSVCIDCDMSLDCFESPPDNHEHLTEAVKTVDRNNSADRKFIMAKESACITLVLASTEAAKTSNR